MGISALVHPRSAGRSPAEPGAIKITTPTGTFPLVTSDAACAAAAPHFELFSQSGVTSFDGDGTGKFPAFHAEITPPAPVQLVAGPVVRGQALALTWQAASSEGLAIDVHTLPAKGSTTTPPWIRCELPDTGSLTIDASLTALLAAEGSTANIFATRAARVVQAPTAKPVVIFAAVERMNQLVVDYTP